MNQVFRTPPSRSATPASARLLRVISLPSQRRSLPSLEATLLCGRQSTRSRLPSRTPAPSPAPPSRSSTSASPSTPATTPTPSRSFADSRRSSSRQARPRLSLLSSLAVISPTGTRKSHKKKHTMRAIANLFLHYSTSQEWLIPSGSIAAHVGLSSRDIHATASFTPIAAASSYKPRRV